MAAGYPFLAEWLRKTLLGDHHLSVVRSDTGGLSAASPLNGGSGRRYFIAGSPVAAGPQPFRRSPAKRRNPALQIKRPDYASAARLVLALSSSASRGVLCSIAASSRGLYLGHKEMKREGALGFQIVVNACWTKRVSSVRPRGGEVRTTSAARKASPTPGRSA
jgi:hypothetical protein